MSESIKTQVFELIENSGDEYYPIGIFETGAECLEEINRCDEENTPVYEYAEDSERITIMARTFGLSGNGIELYVCHRHRDANTGEWHTRVDTRSKVLT